MQFFLGLSLANNVYMISSQACQIGTKLKLEQNSNSVKIIETQMVTKLILLQNCNWNETQIWI